MHRAGLALPLIVLLTGCALLPRHDQPVRVLVLNMHAGKDAAGQSNLDRVAELIASTAADLVLLQEVDRGTNRSGRVAQVDALERATGYAGAFGASLLDYDGGQFGIAVLTSGRISYQQTHPLVVTPVQTRAGGSHEPRVGLAVIARVRREPWRVVNTHLDPSEAQARQQEAEQIANLALRQIAAGTPLVVGGDLNSTPDDPVHPILQRAGLRDAWAECGQGDGFTYPADTPSKRIDYLFLTGNVHCSAAQVIDTQISDHRPLLVTVR
jgi:endonuclease/exonuclease/phosphatase family metal-dependent hydrolase